MSDARKGPYRRFCQVQIAKEMLLKKAGVPKTAQDIVIEWNDYDEYIEIRWYETLTEERQND